MKKPLENYNNIRINTKACSSSTASSSASSSNDRNGNSIFHSKTTTTRSSTLVDVDNYQMNNLQQFEETTSTLNNNISKKRIIFKTKVSSTNVNTEKLSNEQLTNCLINKFIKRSLTYSGDEGNNLNQISQKPNKTSPSFKANANNKKTFKLKKLDLSLNSEDEDNELELNKHQVEVQVPQQLTRGRAREKNGLIESPPKLENEKQQQPKKAEETQTPDDQKTKTRLGMKRKSSEDAKQISEQINEKLKKVDQETSPNQLQKAQNKVKSEPKTENATTRKESPRKKINDSVNISTSSSSPSPKSKQTTRQAKEEEKKKFVLKTKQETNKALAKTQSKSKKELFDDDDDEDEDKDEFKLKIIKKSNTISNLNLADSAQNKPVLSSQMSSNSNGCPSTSKTIKHRIFSSKNDANDSNERKKSAFQFNFDANFDQDDEENSNHSGKWSTSSHSGDRNSEKHSSKATNSSHKASSTDKKSSTHQSSSSTKASSSSNSSNRKERMDQVQIFDLRNSRKAYECEELGETQAFMDDLYYLMDGLNRKYKLSERCLSAIKLAEQGLSSEFRMNLRSLDISQYLSKILNLLSDANKSKSLALCTSLIIFALTQDKLVIDIDKAIFHLILSIINENEMNDEEKSDDTLTNNEDESECDEQVYKKILDRCKGLYVKLVKSMNNSIETNENEQHEDEMQQQQFVDSTLFNSQLLAIECLLNLNLNKQHDLELIDFYKTELRQMHILDKLLDTLRLFIDLFNKSNRNNYYLLNKYAKYLSLLDISTQQTTNPNSQHHQQQPSSPKSISSTQSSSYDLSIEYSSYNNNTCKDLTITYKSFESNQHSTASNAASASTLALPSSSCAPYVLNQNYLVEFNINFLIRLFKDSLNLFFKQFELIHKQEETEDKSRFKYKSNVLTTSIKQTLLVLLNLTHNNELTSKKLALSDDLIDLIFKCVSSDANKLKCNDQFDISIMSLGVLLNIFDTILSQPEASHLVRSKKILNGQTAFEILLELYKTKETLVLLAENAQEDEFNQLNQQIETQNVDNSTIMNSIHKAGKHMEDHIVAAHTALLIGYMLITSEKQNDLNKFLRLVNKPNELFKGMQQMIRKFLEFMKIMKVTGFSKDEHIQLVLNFMDKLRSKDSTS